MDGSGSESCGNVWIKRFLKTGHETVKPLALRDGGLVCVSEPLCVDGDQSVGVDVVKSHENVEGGRMRSLKLIQRIDDQRRRLIFIRSFALCLLLVLLLLPLLC